MQPMRRRHRGFTLIEALVALLLASAGLLGIARLQAAVLGDGTGVAQQTEAQRLLSNKIEEFRSLPSAQLSTLANGSDLALDPVSKTEFSRQWTVTTANGARQRLATVSVGWTDRRGEARTVQASTLVDGPEGLSAVALTQPMSFGQTLRGPLDRNVDVPLKANLVGDGRSVFSIRTTAGSTISFVVDDVSGRVVLRCTSFPTTTQLINQTAAGCSPYNGVLVSGFIGGVNQTVSVGLLGLSIGILRYPNGIDTSSVSGTDTSRNIECEYAEAYRAGSFISVAVNDSDTYRYTCAVPLAANSAGWSGFINMGGGLSLLTLSTVRVCRYRYPEAPDTDPNRRNVQGYRNVTESLFNQNYVISTGPTCSQIDSSLLVEHQVCTPLTLLCSRARS
jgi:prepilin-type N-terminal cleavage/methylation domain-containing protein